MIEEYSELLKKGVSGVKSSRKMLSNMDRKKADILFRKHHDQVFSVIDCLDCANCCATTGPLLLEKDIDRISRHLRIKPSDFIQKYLRRDEDNDWVFQTLPCPFLMSDNYCSIYEVRPKACREYPHTDSRNILQIRKKTLINSTICPAVVLILEGLKGELNDS